jgi:hypothetical protein
METFRDPKSHFNHIMMSVESRILTNSRNDTPTSPCHTHIPLSNLSALKIETTSLLVNWRAVASSDCFRYGSSMHSPGQAPIDPIARLRRYTHHHKALSKKSALQPRPGSSITVST